MVFQQHQDRMHATSLQARSHEQRGIDTSTHLVVQHLIHQTDALTVFESGRWCVIDDASSCQCLIDRTHDGTHAVRVLRLVFVESIAPRQLA